MTGSPQYDFITTELDPELLSTPFQILTNWHVLTGAACSGKTTIIDLLADRGFQTIPETARQYIDLELAKGRTFEDMLGNATDELSMTNMQVSVEQGIRATDTTFLDRTLPDSLAFYRFCELDPNEILVKCFQHRYASVFMLDRLPFHQNGARLDHDATATLLDEWLVRDYSALGYEVVMVPVLPPKERLAFVLEFLCTQGLI